MVSDSHSALEMGVTLPLLVLAWITWMLRVWVRTNMLKTFGIDDWLMTVAMAIFTTHVVNIMIGINHQMDQHYTEITPKNFPIAFKHVWLSGLFYALAIPFVKASIGALLLRFIRRKLYVYIVYVAIVVTIAGNLYTFFTFLTLCKPVSFFWTRTGHGSCKPVILLAKSTLGQNTINFVTDLVFGLLPAFVVAELHMNRNTKVSLAGVLLIGNTAMIATAVRFKFVVPFLTLPADYPDYLYLSVNTRILSTVEVGIGCIMGSAVTLRPLFRTILHLGSSYQNESSRRKRSDYANQLHSLDNLENQSRANDGVLPLYPTNTTRVIAGKEPTGSRHTDKETGSDDESFEGKGGIQRDISYTITHDRP